MTRIGRGVLATVLASQALRGLGYGLAAVQLGAVLRGQGLDSTAVGLVLAAVVAGSAAASLALGRWGDRVGRARAYRLLYLALAGVVLAADGPAWLLALVALSGALSTEVVESGPFTTLEQVMLASADTRQPQLVRGLVSTTRPLRWLARPARCWAPCPPTGGSWAAPSSWSGGRGAAGRPAPRQRGGTTTRSGWRAASIGVLPRSGAAAGRAVRHR
jgi:MFS family permease